MAASASAMPLDKRACDGPDVNSATLELIKKWEGFVESPEPDPVGYPTVGYGHLCQSSGCSEVEFDFPLSESEASKLLAGDIGVRFPLILFHSLASKLTLPTKQTYQDGVSDVLGSSVELNDNQYGALVSWCFNMGTGAVAESSLISRLNDGEEANDVIEEELPKWVHAGGEVLDGLVRRRNDEIKLAQTSSDTPALPC